MSWVKWDSILLSYMDWGLNIGSLKVNNWALLGKWWRRFCTKIDAFGLKIIKSIYGRGWGGGGLDNSNHNRIGIGHSPWKDIIRTGKDITKCGFNFNNNFSRTIGEGRNILFWEDQWIGDQFFKDKYPRIYRLEEVKNDKVCDRVSWVNSSPIMKWQWRRLQRDINDDELNSMVQDIACSIHNDNANDGWKWSVSGDGKFYTKELTAIHDKKLHGQITGVKETVGNRLLPQSLGIFVWRAKRRRLPVRVELDNRGIDLHTVRRPMCDEDVESTDHALVLCKHAFKVWERVYHWWGLGNFSSTSVSDLFNGECNNARGLNGNTLWQAVEWV
ncbi:uncharacterized protein [Rutidosis leptorrhynchoides]|uniref:uncharacterized protein n=1 Tax=Rutidosis leptorrhynchoides TaxID=125765 RepID=UPI003A990EF7